MNGLVAVSGVSDVLVALIAAVPASIIAWATYVKVSRGGAENTAQHAEVAVALAEISRRQEWQVEHLAKIQQALLDHVMWEEGRNGRPGKYEQIESVVNEVAQHLTVLEKGNP